MWIFLHMHLYGFLTYGRHDRYSVLVGRPIYERRLGRSERRWEDNIKMYLEERV
jgi:hypothetical protein